MGRRGAAEEEGGGEVAQLVFNPNGEFWVKRKKEQIIGTIRSVGSDTEGDLQHSYVGGYSGK